jgi:hypothetical protein
MGSGECYAWCLLELFRKGGTVPETSYIFMARRMCLLGMLMTMNDDHDGVV